MVRSLSLKEQEHSLVIICLVSTGLQTRSTSKLTQVKEGYKLLSIWPQPSVHAHMLYVCFIQF